MFGRKQKQIDRLIRRVEDLERAAMNPSVIVIDNYYAQGTKVTMRDLAEVFLTEYQKTTPVPSHFVKRPRFPGSL